MSRSLTQMNLARLVTLRNLDPFLQMDGVERLCRQAVELGFHSICIGSCWVKGAKATLLNKPVKVSCLIGSEAGNTSGEALAYEARLAVSAGADEIEMVMNIGLLLGGNYNAVKRVIKGVVFEAGDVPVKVALGTTYLTDHLIHMACDMSVEAGAKFVKTQAGNVPSSSMTHHLSLMREVVGPDFGVSASNEVDNWNKALLAMGAAGVSSSLTPDNFRIDCQNAVQIAGG